MPSAQANASGAMADAGVVEKGKRRMLVVGDVQGKLSKVFGQVANQEKRIGKLDFLLSVGSFLPGEDSIDGANQFQAYVIGKEHAQVECFFIENRSAAVLQSFPSGRTFCENVHFLGGYGIREIQGLQVAYLSGRYDAATFGTADAQSVPTPDFIGAAFTWRAIESLKKLAQEPGRPPIDILLTSDWPSGIEQRLDPSEQPKDPDGNAIDWASVSAAPIAELCAVLEPRYHIFGTNDIFYQRPPFQHLHGAHVCRCIGLGKVGSKGKSRKWLHGMQLTPATTISEVALKQRPENTTPCPFLIPRQSQSGLVASTPEVSKKRSAAEISGSEAEEIHIVPNEVFLSRLPANINEKQLQAVFSKCGKIEDLRVARAENEEGKPCKGFGWITFSSPEEAQEACKLNEFMECKGKKINICISQKKPRGSGGVPRRKGEIQIVIEPHSECWFCLVNPKVEKHMIISATTQVYVAGTRGPINPNHVLVLPVKHAPCFAACPTELQDCLTAHVAAIRTMCQAAGQDCFVWERWIPMGKSAANHMQIQVLPFDQQRAMGAREALEAVGKKRLNGATFRKIYSHREVIEHVKDDAHTPYIYFEIPGENTANGRQIERYVYAGSHGGPRVPMNLGREVACHLLNCENKVDWRQCQEDKDAERRHATSFREKFKSFLPF